MITSNIKDVVKKMDKRQEKIVFNIKKALYDIGFHIGKESIEITPIDTGNLRGTFTAKVEGDTIAIGSQNGLVIVKPTVGTIGNNAVAQLKLTVGFNTFYAYIVHENFFNKYPNVNWSDPNTGPYYLKKVLEDNIDFYKHYLYKAISDSLK